MPINTLYHTWFRRIQELRPGQRITQVRNFVWLMIGIYQSCSVCLSCIAGKIPSPAKLMNIARRVERLLDNPAIRVLEWCEPIASEWLDAQFRCLDERILTHRGIFTIKYLPARSALSMGGESSNNHLKLNISY